MKIARAIKLIDAMLEGLVSVENDLRMLNHGCYREVYNRRRRTTDRRISPRHRWTQQEDEILRREFPNGTTPALSKKLRLNPGQVHSRAGVLGIKKSAAYMAKHPGGLDGKIGACFRFKKGLIPWNKGEKLGPARGRSALTTFKKGERRGAAAAHWMPVGSKRIIASYWYTKVADKNQARGGSVTWCDNWKLTHRLLWKKHGRKIPKASVLIFKNGNRNDIRIGNLKCITLRENRLRNSAHRMYPKPLFNLIMAKARLTRVIRDAEGRKPK